MRCVGLVRDVTDAKRAHERLLHDAVHDSLTGLPNRELVLDRLGVAAGRAKSDSGVRPSVVFIDIDKFKSVNVSFGLVVGDSLLLTVARRLQSHLGPHDTLARVGGDQFAILLVTEQSPQDLAGLAERVRRSLRAPIKIAGQEIVLTGSIGIAVYDGETPSHLDLYKEAEIAMYRAKRGGADRIEIFRPEMRADRDDRVALESDLRKALAKNQIKVLYQPIIYLPTEELAGFEALVRWEHPKRGLMSPDDFIPIAEQSDLIVRLGSHVLLRAAHEAARWQRELPREERPLFVSVNISSRQVFRQNLIQEIRHILGRNIVPKGSLRLEITESLVMENPEQATEILEWLRGAGAQLALDDFGTGYSSLAYLQRFPFDTIKIDRALVQASGDSGGAGSAIVRSIVALGHELGKSVVAEGVETAEDVGFLRSINCQYAQGFYYGEPMSDRDVLQLLKMVRTAEHKLRPRGLFRAKPKSKQRDRKPAAVAAKPNGAVPPLPLDANGRPPAPPSTLPNSTLRPRPRPSAPPQLNGMAMAPAGAPPPLPLHMHHDDGPPGEPAIHALPPPMPSDFAAPGPEQHPPMHQDQADGFSASPHDTHQFAAPPPPPQFAALTEPSMNGAPPSGAPDAGPPPPSSLMDQFAPPPQPDHYTPAPEFAPPPSHAANGAPSLFNGFADPMAPLGEHPMQSVPPGLGEPAEPNPLLAALQNQTSPPAEALRSEPAFAPMQPNGGMPPGHPLPPRHAPALPPSHAGASGSGNGPGNGAKPARRAPDFSGLPPAMAESLAKLAGVPWPPRPDDEELEHQAEASGPLPGMPQREG
jgi:diguanylate cyclase (GGDEF)-like protein